jgi:hypothetical protein
LTLIKTTKKYKNMKKRISILIIVVTIMASCNNSKKDNLTNKKTEKIISNSPKDKKIDSKHITYLQEYEDPDASGTHEIEFKKIKKNVFWVTHYEGAGTRQEYYWKNVNNLLVPCFIFEYGGMDWEASLEYNFEDIKTGKKKEGSATEADIIRLKENFIKENFKSI